MHGADAAERAERAGEALFRRGIAELDEATLLASRRRRAVVQVVARANSHTASTPTELVVR